MLIWPFLAVFLSTEICQANVEEDYLAAQKRLFRLLLKSANTFDAIIWPFLAVFLSTEILSLCKSSRLERSVIELKKSAFLDFIQ